MKSNSPILNISYSLSYKNFMQFEVQAETSEWLRVRTQLK